VDQNITNSDISIKQLLKSCSVGLKLTLLMEVLLIIANLRALLRQSAPPQCAANSFMNDRQGNGGVKNIPMQMTLPTAMKI
jgi:predicted lysophospholipase L1 biosynthesis ABC-type transport system permease subunit